MASEKIHLTTKEKSELWVEGLVTVILLLLLNFALIVMIDQMIVSDRQWASAIWTIKTTITFGGNHLWSWQNLFIIVMAVADVIVVYWRLIRRYRQMQLRHIIGELHYIAEGHLNHRIRLEVGPDMEKVVSSINALVDSAVKSMEEERKIEASKDELITNVSHDIRTPLTSIIGYLGLIEDRQYRTEAEMQKYVHTAYLKSKQMKVLVEDLFEYTKVRSTTTKLTLAKFDMAAMLDQLAASFELEGRKKGIEFDVHCDPTPLMMEADSEKLGRVFNNLIINALKYGKGAKHVYLSAEKIGSEVVVRVANDGQQIPTGSLNQLFDRFYRVEESRSQETGGSGLGLAIAQSIVTLHGGYIFADSNRELTSFVMHLPLKTGVTLKRDDKESV
ncbi:sensor histidine kinase [Lacticaseibacillus sharpeae]|uniref:histidine kinase n=1 Tax=Lacticaseibacillus sharpeae JCM 1186 = DSM 20505 TaxID=1291052 RepID=A0A0R1ZX44_9LACO|nr:HAMP domain-containing sensor histidine kinase [Lacticaseibacillus sharpeae]KRM55651.1 two component sensor transduction histidine kinase [Lacticaseibacillus sharpeae JCM 1186 = DSM 20505]